jgi:hypothetical protein
LNRLGFALVETAGTGNAVIPPVVREDRMSIISKLVALGLAASFGSPSHQNQIDFKEPATQRINELWLVTFINDSGEETVIQAKLTNGDYAPLIAADPVRRDSMIPAARDIAKTRNVKLRLIKLTNRVDIEVITP